MNRKQFIQHLGITSSALMLFGTGLFGRSHLKLSTLENVKIRTPKAGEDILSFIEAQRGRFDLKLYKQIIGACSEFKEGDEALGLTADNESSRVNARILLSNTPVGDLVSHTVFEDDLLRLINQTTDQQVFQQLKGWKMQRLKEFVCTKSESDIHQIIPGLPSDVIGCLVKLMTNEELIAVGQKVFNPLPNSQIGSKGYMSARVQPNSPTDNVDDIVWQVFDAWSYTVGDLVLGTNPVSSNPSSVAAIEKALYDIIVTFGLEDIIPNCVLSHIDIQAEVETLQPGTTGIWFQSLAGTVEANKTFDVTIDKMFRHASKRQGKYGLYAETGQGADFTNGHGEGFDMLLHESRKYGFLRALKQELSKGKSPEQAPWVHVNDVAGFIGPEVFKTKEQLVRCCLEDTVMGKLHGLPIGLDICSTLHMDITLDDLDWCIEQIMPANPAYLMALPTKNDPMLSYLTTAFNNHLKLRDQFGYKVNDAMWAFFKQLGVIDKQGKPTDHFGDPIWVYYQYRLAKGDSRTKSEIYREGESRIKEIRKRGVPIARGYGKEIWDLQPELDKEVRSLYADAKVSIWTEMSPYFKSSIPAAIAIQTKSSDRKDYVYHPESGEKLEPSAVSKLNKLKSGWDKVPDVQIVISDGLNARALMDEGHLKPFLDGLRKNLTNKGFKLNNEHILITHGRVRAGYQCGELLFGIANNSAKARGIIHIIGERPGSGHHNFSAYITAASEKTWSKKGEVDHNITRVVSGISDTALSPERAARETAQIFEALFKESA